MSSTGRGVTSPLCFSSDPNSAPCPALNKYGGAREVHSDRLCNGKDFLRNSTFAPDTRQCQCWYGQRYHGIVELSCLPQLLVKPSYFWFQGLRSLNACRGHRSSQTLRASFHRASSLALTSSQITVTDEPDTLFQKVSVLVKGHDRSVLDSYEFFATMAAKELGITLGNVFEPPKDVLRLTLLKSIHIFKKHRVQYEMRTHYRCLELFRLTGSTAQVYLEYIQRNLPEGVAMEVSKIAVAKVPEHILQPMWEEPTADNAPSPTADLKG
ncbi:small ribosomal subunit protein uS10m isoform X2 [Gadus morhua]|uniref:small ribosomal subunit protein uS10m isoform X2 n=1 Tax=Gadus morhua TaxID=8049 RepID=UPI0011B677B6|nr:28S ribosomal protein S10, mitochondrial isoform X2 [Gadus morhua]